MKKILTLIILIISIFTIKVNASSYGMYLNSSTTSVNSGEEIIVNISLGNINGIDLGLNVCQASISSSGVIINTISGLNGWNVTNGGTLIMDSANSLTYSAPIATIKAKVSSNGSISLSNIVCSDGENEYTTGATSISFSIKEEVTTKTNTETINTKNQNTTTNNETVNKTNNNTSNTKNKEEIKSSLLKSLMIDDLEFEFDKNVFEYNLEVDNTVDKINLKYELEDNNAKIEKIGNDELKIGSNIIELNITNEKNTSKYIINIIRKDIIEEVNNNEEEILNALKQNIKLLKVKVNYDDNNKIITPNILKYLKENKKDIIYTIYNNNKKIYSFKIYCEGISEIKDISFEILNSSNYNDINKLISKKKYRILNFNYSGNLPSNTEVTIFNVNMNDNVYLYYYNSNKNELEYVDNYLVKDNTLTIKIDHCSEYVLLDKKIEPNNLIILISIIILIITIITGIIIVIIKKNTKFKH